MSKNETSLNTKPQPSTYVRTKPRCSAPDGRFLDDHCGGDLGWEQRMRVLNPNWRPTDNSLWDAYHE